MPITTEAHRKLWKERTSPTGKRLFFQLLHTARQTRGWGRHSYLLGVRDTLEANREDFTIVDKMRDLWKQGGVFE